MVLEFVYMVWLSENTVPEVDGWEYSENVEDLMEIVESDITAKILELSFELYVDFIEILFERELVDL